MKQRQTLQNYKTFSTRHNFQAKIKYYTILETLKAIIFDEIQENITYVFAQWGGYSYVTNPVVSSRRATKFEISFLIIANTNFLALYIRIKSNKS